jgi:lipopolysaccharide transport system permease protein
LKSLTSGKSLNISSRSGWFELNLRELFQYRELIWLLIIRELKPTYKQTILGPLWFVLQPVLMTFIYSIVFGRVAKIPVGDCPPLLFYLSGIILWNFFNGSFLKNANIFSNNAHLFSKIYFPRLVVPIAALGSTFFNFLIQFCLFLLFGLWYHFTGFELHFGSGILLTPLIIIMLSCFSTGMGLIVSGVSTRYKDLNHFLAFGSQLLMYATPIIYPERIIPETYRWIVLINPLSAFFEWFRYSFLGMGIYSPERLLAGGLAALLVLSAGVLVFNKAQRDSVDTI